MPELTNVQAIKEFFQSSGGRTVTMEELKSLSKEERDEIGKLCINRLKEMA